MGMPNQELTIPPSKANVNSSASSSPRKVTHHLRLGELFCGPGGIGCGASMVNVERGSTAVSIRHAWATDMDPDSCETYRRNIGEKDGTVIACADIRTLAATKFHALPGPIDILTFGFPCNDFSVVGERRGLHGNFGPLYSYGIRAVQHFRPSSFVAENVGGLRSANAGDALGKILRDMAAAKPQYDLTAHLYRFEHYGVPQARHRVIIVGILKRLGLKFLPPAPTTLSSPRTVADVLGNSAKPVPALNNEPTRQSKRVVERLRLIRPGENVWNAKLPRHLQLNVVGARLSQIYRRLHPDRPAYTITGSGGGGTHVYHWREPRALTNRERARLQTFPDTYDFAGSKESVRKQIGMAVPPEGAKIILESVIKCLFRIPYSSIPASLH